MGSVFSLASTPVLRKAFFDLTNGGEGEHGDFPSESGVRGLGIFNRR
jgi:hypothetical protein